MSPVIHVGPSCVRWQELGSVPPGPVFRAGHCAACYRLLEAFGHPPQEPASLDVCRAAWAAS